MKASLIEVNPDNCRSCRLCEMVCSLHHEQECSVTKSRIRILKDSEWAFDCPLLCIQCAEAPCVDHCSTGAIHRDEATGVVRVDAQSCVGCGDCIPACPVHGLFLDEEKATIFKCDLCAGDPECVKWCPNKALVLKEVEIDSPDRRAFLEKASGYIETAG
jgi:carbon-monoxide dehydrogenase iron sulfur subunit